MCRGSPVSSCRPRPGLLASLCVALAAAALASGSLPASACDAFTKTTVVGFSATGDEVLLRDETRAIVETGPGEGGLSTIRIDVRTVRFADETTTSASKVCDGRSACAKSSVARRDGWRRAWSKLEAAGFKLVKGELARVTHLDGRDGELKLQSRQTGETFADNVDLVLVTADKTRVLREAACQSSASAVVSAKCDGPFLSPAGTHAFTLTGLCGNQELRAAPLAKAPPQAAQTTKPELVVWALNRLLAKVPDGKSSFEQKVSLDGCVVSVESRRWLAGPADIHGGIPKKITGDVRRISARAESATRIALDAPDGGAELFRRYGKRGGREGWHPDDATKLTLVTRNEEERDAVVAHLDQLRLGCIGPAP